MRGLAETGGPVSVPAWAHLVLWPALLLWMAVLVGQRRRRAWPCNGRVGALLVPLCLLADGAAFVAATRWPYPDASAFVFALLWLAVLLSVTTYFALRTPEDGRGGDGQEPPSQPPWWPEFERELRDYMRRGPRPSGARPRAPVGT
jgi:hypothetical protein